MKRLAAFAPLIALAVVVLIAVVLLVRPNPTTPTFSTGDANRPAPTYALARLGGGELVTSDDLRGRPYLINVFASWCTPCRAEHPVLMVLEGRGVPIVGIDYKDNAADAQRVLADLGDPYRAVASDPDGRFGLELGIAGVPETFVIGADGAIRAVHRGPLTQDVVDQEIMPALLRP